MNRRAVFLDRDGVINRTMPGDGYVTRWEDMHFLPGISRSVALLNQAGFRVIVVTNQRCVAKGLITSHGLDALHRRMCEWLAAEGAKVDGVYYCPHEKQPACNCRKPAAGMLFEAARAHHIDLTASWMIGDKEIDVEAGKNAGCKTARLLISNEIKQTKADVVAQSLLEAINHILHRDKIIAQGLAIDIAPAARQGDGRCSR